MKLKSRAMIALIVTFALALVLIGILYLVNRDNLGTWFPQALLTLAALVGASWFAGNRLDLFDKDIQQRKGIGEGQLIASERTNFNIAVKEAIILMSSDKPYSVSAGQRWLHVIASVGTTEANLVQSFLCQYLTDALVRDVSKTVSPTQMRLYQLALNLLFHVPHSERFSECDIADLSGCRWWGMDFTELNLRKTTFVGGRFANATINGTRFESSDLRQTGGSSHVGGRKRTYMSATQLCGANSSSTKFENIDFTKANFSNNGNKTRFASCWFIDCDFRNSDWTGAVFQNCLFNGCIFDGAIWNRTVMNTPKFHRCEGLTYDLSVQANLSKPEGLPQEVYQSLMEKGLLGNDDN